MSVRYQDNRRAAKRLSWVLLFAIGVTMTVTLYYVKTRAQTAKNEVRALQKSITQEAAAIKVLEAELAYLSGPERLAKLSTDELKLDPILPDATKTESDIEQLFPLRPEPAIDEGTQP